MNRLTDAPEPEADQAAGAGAFVTQAGAWALPTVADRIAGALDALDRGAFLLPVDPATKAPYPGFRAQPYLDGRRNLDQHQVERWAARGAVFAVALKPSGVLVADLDTRDPGAVGALAACFAGEHVTPTRSGGRHAWYRRPAGLPARRIIRAGGLPLDLLSHGIAVLWTGRMPPLADLPPELVAALRPPDKPKPPKPTSSAPAPGSGSPAALPGTGRAAAYLRAAFDGAAVAVAALPEGTRQDGLYDAAVGLGFALAAVERPDLDADAGEVLAAAAPWADTRKERDTIRRGIAWGIEHGRAGLPDRPGWSPGAAPVGELGLADQLRADTRAAAERTLGLLDAALEALTPERFTIECERDGTTYTRVNVARRASVKLLTTRILERVAELGYPTVYLSLDRTGIEAGRSAGTARAVLADLAALGITRERAADRDGAPGVLTGAWAVDCEFLATLARDSLAGAGALVLEGGKHPRDLPENTRRARAQRVCAASELCRGARAGALTPTAPTVQRRCLTRDGRPEMVERFLSMGPMAHVFLEAVYRLAGEDRVTVAALVADLDTCMSERSVREYARRAVELGLMDATPAPAAGRGRPALLYRLADQTAAAWREAVERGRKAIARAWASAERRAAEVREVLKRFKGWTGDALSDGERWRLAWAQFREHASGLRAGNRGRTDTESRARAIKATRGLSRGILDCLAIRAADAPMPAPPAWALVPQAELGL